MRGDAGAAAALGDAAGLLEQVACLVVLRPSWPRTRPSSSTSSSLRRSSTPRAGAERPAQQRLGVAQAPLLLRQLGARPPRSPRSARGCFSARARPRSIARSSSCRRPSRRASGSSAQSRSSSSSPWPPRSAQRRELRAQRRELLVARHAAAARARRRAPYARLRRPGRAAEAPRALRPSCSAPRGARRARARRAPRHPPAAPPRERGRRAGWRGAARRPTARSRSRPGRVERSAVPVAGAGAAAEREHRRAPSSAGRDRRVG